MNRHKELINRQRIGFTLVEVIIVTVLLAVLLSGVWSMFQMQSRMMEQGQRLSRESSETRSMWLQFRSDVQQIQLPLIAQSQGNSGRPDRPSQPPRSPDESLEVPPPEPAGDFSDFNAALGWESHGDQVADAAFVLDGESDWFVFDIKRSWSQWPGLSTGATGASGSSSTSASSLNYAGASGNSNNSYPATPYQRVMYVWLTTEELKEWFPIEISAAIAGADSLSNVPAGDDVDSENSSSLSLTSSNAAPARWLIRLTWDWGTAAATDQSESIADTNASEVSAGAQGVGSASIDGLGADPSTAGMGQTLDGTAARKRVWLQRFLNQPNSRFLDFETWQGNVTSNLETTEEVASEEVAEETNSWIPEPGRVQIDWLTTVVDGQFQYLVGDNWRSSTSSISFPNRPLRAIELQYNVDANHVPRPPIDGASETLLETQNLASDLESLPGFDELPEPTADEYSDEATDNALTLTTLPEFQNVCLVAIPTQPAALDSRPGQRPFNRGSSSDNSILEDEGFLDEASLSNEEGQ